MIKIFSKNFFIKKHAKIFPHLLIFQKKLFQKPFVNGKIENIIKKVFPIFSKDCSIKISFLKVFFKKPFYCLNYYYERKETYSFRVYVKLKISILKNNFVKKFSKVYLLCEIPLILKNFSFLINGIERVVISQLIKSPGFYIEKKKKDIIFKIIPLKGIWLEIIFNEKKIYFRINGKKKVNIMILLKIFKMDINDIFNSFSLTRYIKIKNKKIFIKFDINNYKGFNGNLHDEYGNLIIKNGKIIKKKHKNIYVLLSKKYYKNIIVCEDFKKKNIFIKSNDRINYNKLFKLNEVLLIKVFDFLSNSSEKFILNSFFLKNFIDYNSSLKFLHNYLNPKKKFNKEKFFFYSYYKKIFRTEKFFFLSDIVRKKINNFFNIKLSSQFIEKKDIICIIKYLISKKIKISDLDSLENKIIKCSGNFVEDIIKKKINLLYLNILDRISKKKNNFNFEDILNSKIISVFIKEFFCISQFSQFLDNNNNLSEITHKRRLTTLGPGGFQKGKISNNMRNLHLSNYGRICPVETPEGKNIGLVNSFAVFSKINENYYIETPYLKIKDSFLINKYFYLDYFSEFNSFLSINLYLNLKKKIILCRKKNKIDYFSSNKLNYTDISPIQIFSLATLMIPFVEHNDANRALMGSNMQRQSITGILKNLPYICTGLEFLPSLDLGYSLYLKNSNIIYSDSKITILTFKKKNIFLYKIYDFKKFNSSNQKNIINNTINNFEKKKKFFLLNDNSNTVSGRISLGQNLLTAFISFEGYNFEDSIVISEKISRSDLYSSLHSNEVTVKLKKTKYGTDKINKIFYINKNNSLKLNKNGFPKIGFYFLPGEVLLARIRPHQLNYSPEEKLVNIILENNKNLNYEEKYIRLPNDISGILTKIEIVNKKSKRKIFGYSNKKYKLIYKKIKKHLFFFVRKKNRKKFYFYNLIILKNRLYFIKRKIKNLKKIKFSLNNEVYKKIKFTFISRRFLKVGDKMSGRHGNKGVISKILPIQDMPFLNDGTPVDLLLNPLGVPSRMNIGQLFEINFGFLVFGILKRIDYYLNKKSLKLIRFLKKLKFKIPKKIFDIESYKKISFFSIPFEGASIKDSKKLSKFIFNKRMKNIYCLNKYNDKLILKDGRTGNKFNDFVNVGYMYFMKLHHIAHEKIHFRSIGPYSLITQQPLKGKSNMGGQRFGEMEVWALEAYGSAYILQELLTIKSDDIVGRMITYENISKGKNKININLPESFKILIKEINSLCLNIKIK
ncbi:DNA-directed RNA polymerase subunit beta [Candidatus Vidania fulgoroideorum]